MKDPFSYFIDSCSNLLDFLCFEYSFLKNEPKVMPPECSIEYLRGNSAIDVIYEYGDFPWIRVSIQGKENSLDNIIKKNWPIFAINRKKGPKDPDERVDYIISRYARVLKDHTLEIIGAGP
jgi:hypothetical protein